MKNYLKTILIIGFASIFSVPAIVAAPENHEEFARQYMPETQAVFERFRKECAEAKVLSEDLEKNLKTMNCELDEDAAYCALVAKIKTLEAQEAEWVKLVKDCYFKHKGNLLSIDLLSEINAKTAKEKIEWEKNKLKPFLKYFVTSRNAGIPIMVEIPGEGYSIGMFEVTQREYKSVMKTNPSCFKGDSLPVERVSRSDAMAFCERLTARERQKGCLKGYKYTLPTSKQWEIACRAGTTTRFCSGDSRDDLDKVAWYYLNSGRTTHPVGTKAPNAWGIYDMHGNVWERCLDVHPNYRSEYVSRGGSWRGCNLSTDCESSLVYGHYSDDRDDDLGFRVALVPTEETQFYSTVDDTKDDATKKYVVQKGDNIYMIMRSVGCSLKELQALNPDTDLRRLRVGQTIIVPAK